jgi:carbon catabolite-derepressing protein kinase
VYRARHLGTGGIFAVKLIDSAAVSRSPKTFNNLQREITAMQRVSGHAHVVGLVHFDMAASKPRKRRAGQFQPVIMLVLELAVGGEIFDYLMLSKLHEDVARTYFNQLLEALHFCHNNGVAHRDLKPENLLLDGNYNLRVADWGLSAVMDDIDAAMLRTQCGTRAYMAPELLRREPYKGQPADMWSAGVVLFIMLSGFPPFETASAGDWYVRTWCSCHSASCLW